MKDFQNTANRINLLCSNVSDLLSERTEDEIQNQLNSFKDFIRDYSIQKKLVLGFIGQYNAGKSTIIAGLTNARYDRKYEEKTDDGTKLVEVYKVGNKEIKIGAQIMTDISEEYEWGDVLLLDTPGIYSGRPEHDSITLDKLSMSDLLVFIVPNELFNPECGRFFRRVAFELKRKGQLLLIVNKMTRETGTKETLRNDILRVIEPGAVEDFCTTFVDASFYLKSLHEVNSEERDFLESQSNFSEFVNSLETLIVKNKLTAKLYTPLHRSLDLIEYSLNILSIDNKENRDLKEFYRRKILILKASKSRLNNNINSELSKLTFKVWNIGNDIAVLCDGQHEKSEIEKAFKDSEPKLQEISKESFEQVFQITQDEVARINNEFSELTNSPLGKSIANQLGVPINEIDMTQNLNISQKDGLPDVLKRGPDFLAKLSGFASQVSRDMVYNFVKFFGGKFKPWGAVKFAKFINKLGPVLSVVGSILEVILTLKEEKDKGDYEKQLRDNRTEIRKTFSDIGEKMIKDFENGWIDDEGVKYEGFKKVIYEDFYGVEINSADEAKIKLLEFDESKKDFINRLKVLRNKINIELESEDYQK